MFKSALGAVSLPKKDPPSGGVDGGRKALEPRV